MEKKWLWLILFLALTASGIYLWRSGSSAPSTVQPEENPENSALADPETPALGSNREQVRPTLPGARSDERDFRTQPEAQPGLTPPPGAGSGSGTIPTPGALNTNPGAGGFSPPTPTPGGSGEDPPPAAFEPMPQQAFENPEFVTPPPPPTELENQAIPFDEEPTPPPPGPYDSGGGGGGQEDFEPPPEE